MVLKTKHSVNAEAAIASVYMQLCSCFDLLLPVCQSEHFNWHHHAVHFLKGKPQHKDTAICSNKLEDVK